MGKSSTGVVFNGEDYGLRDLGNTFEGGSIYDTVYTGAAISAARPPARRRVEAAHSRCRRAGRCFPTWVRSSTITRSTIRSEGS